MGRLPKSHSRTFARLYALRLLYQAEMSQMSLDEMLAVGQGLPLDGAQDCLHVCTVRRTCEEYAFFTQFSGEPNDYALQVVRGVQEHCAQIDRLICAASMNWALSRMPTVDRAIVRIAVWEVMYNDAVPDSAAINEAVNAAKEFGGEDSPKFVNGILGKVAELKAQQEQAPER